MNIILTGPMGSGKSVVGRAVASALKMDFIDTDDLAEKKAKMSIQEIFELHGEEHYRKIEEEVVKDIFEFDNCIISTGGGIVLNPINMRRLRQNGIIINLKTSFDILFKRVKNKKHRPLLNPQTLKSDLWDHSEGRKQFYNNADYILETDTLEVTQITEKIINITKMPFIKICGCIAGKNPENQIQQAIDQKASLIELRLDLIPNPNIKSLINISGLPVIATDRKNSNNLIKAINEGCDFVDIDINSSNRARIIEIAHSKGCKVIVSLHDFKKTPDEFTIDIDSADIIKIATMIKSKDDSLRLMNLLKSNRNIIIIGMGELGTFIRVFAPLLGSYLTYASITENTAPGQFHISTMNKIYKNMGLQ